ncbi:hypothetical protein Tco_0937447 [Tanacetum coccineum]|uniref:Protein TIC 214 n=1 Tax=Tanacetum coccineum TaxID=301880 RepID=A0ABQ5DFD5_9ASTR
MDWEDLKEDKTNIIASIHKLILRIKKLESKVKGRIDEDPNTYFAQDVEVVHDQDTAAEMNNQKQYCLKKAIRLQEQVDEKERAQVARDEEIERQLLALDEERATIETKITKDIDWNDPSVQRPIFVKIWDFNHNFVPLDLEIKKEKKKPAEFQEIELEQIEKDTTGKRKKSLPRKRTRSTTRDQKSVQRKYSSSKPEGYDLILWGDLHTLFEPDEESEIWMNQNEYNLIS